MATLCLCGALATSRQAVGEDLDPSAATGRFGVVLAGRNNLGDLGELYNLGFLWGVRAGLEKPIGDSEWTIGLGWTTLVRGYYFASDASLVESTIHLTEVNLGVTAAHTFLVPRQTLFGSIGTVLLLSNRPIPPAEDRRYLGWYVGTGFERVAFGEWAWSVEARYSRLGPGLSSLNLVLGMTAGF